MRKGKKIHRWWPFTKGQLSRDPVLEELQRRLSSPGWPPHRDSRLDEAGRKPHRGHPS